jgi:ribosomal protein S24E
MNVEIKETKETALPRTEYVLSVTYEGKTPSRQKIKQKTQLHIDEDESLLIIGSIPSSFGGRSFEVHARQYETREAMHSLEHEDRIEKNKTVKPEEEEASEEPAEEETEEGEEE